MLGIGSTVMQMCLAMTVIVAGAVTFLRYLLPKLDRRMRYEKGMIQLLATKRLGQKKDLLLAGIENRRFLLGVTENAIQLITEIESEPGSELTETE